MRFIIFCLTITSLYSAEIKFNRDIRPILSDRCFHCHGPDKNDRKGHIRLDIPDGKDGAYRIRKGSQGIKPGDPENSEVWQRIITDDQDDIMPPPKSHKKVLNDKERKLIKQWIKEGAKYEEFWAFTTINMPKIPAVKNKNYVANAIDNFVIKKLDEKGLKPSTTADKRTLLRRVTFDLTGLAPTAEEIKNFLNDNSDNAYEKVVDRLLKSPRYGEHMAKYWLDLVRFADTNGRHHDHYRDMTPYRDWVIRSFNSNIPFNNFVKYQIAGDLYKKPTKDQLIASGFNRLHLIIDRGTALPEESFFQNVVDRVSAIGTTFLGLTMECAVCHDHKYDPITMKDFYSMSAFVNNLDAAPETGGRRGTDFRRGLQPPFINLPNPTQEKTLNALEKTIKDVQAKLKTVKDKKVKSQLNDQLRKSTKSRDNLILKMPAAMIMKERSQVRPTFMHPGGQYDKKGAKVTRNTPGFMPPMPKKKAYTRMDLAEWLVSDKQPLTARVMVNRFWQQLFGVGIIKTSEDFGAQGEWPSHPDLLDYLSFTYKKNNWNTKAIMKLMVMSNTYKQTSKASPETYKKDPENRLLARGSRFRMDSEMIRDQILQASNLINLQMYGKSVKPPQPAGLWKAVNMPGSFPRLYVADKGNQIYRRSVYTFWKRGMPPPQMSIFNAPSRETCTARRERTNTPLQALLLMNEEQYFIAAAKIALEFVNKSKLNDKQKIEAIYERLISKKPDEREFKILYQGLVNLKKIYKSSPEEADKIAKAVDLTSTKNKTELAAYTMLVNAMFNLDKFKTRE